VYLGRAKAKELIMKLFVGSLPYDSTDDDLKQLFGQAGSVVSAKVIFDRETGRSRGFGFVEMASEDEGETALEKLDGSQLGGRTIVVKKANKSENDRR